MQVTIKNVSGGILADYIDNENVGEGPEGSYSYTQGMNPAQQGFQGYISTPGVFADGTITDASSLCNSLPRAVTAAVNFATPHIFYITAGLNGVAPRLLFVTGDAIQNFTNDIAIGGTGHIGHNFTTLPTAGTGAWGEDITIWSIGGTAFSFISWNDNTDGDVAQASLNSGGITAGSNWFSQLAGSRVLVMNVPHRLMEGPTKKLYITDGRYLHSVDSSSGSAVATLQDYDMGDGWVIVDIRTDKNSIVVTGVRTSSYNQYDAFGKSRTCYWDGVEDGLGTVYDIDDFYASSCYPFASTMLAFTRGKNSTSKLATLLNKPIGEWVTDLYGAPPDPRSIDIYQKNLVWIPGNYDNLASSNVGPYVMMMSPKGGLHVPYLLNDGSANADKIGVLKNVSGNKLYIGGKWGSTYKICWYAGNSFSQTLTATLTRRYVLPWRSNIVKIRVYFGLFHNGGELYLSLFRNNDSWSPGGATDLLNRQITYASAYLSPTGYFDEIEIVKNIPNVSSFYLSQYLKGAVSIARIEVVVNSRNGE